ncbi:hypothetical protein BK703_16040 [Bacillus thuringiensis serovar silo]|uniref:hypothetical protein n=1 Tax=Bacillus thuringiensis TaxID=1428 RepID=UPI000A3759CD|nr:hypothetical protein [Bacillus thuringiensis]MED3271511.1 hypothetical protein [Bacillus thuringiensis]OTW55723.1 hypothetical protein BK703_16040 [Bacillus thuringiensis serovar silo]OTW63134.1 hypothetical protein BK700_17540 [Bacillus thuringiensis serovar toguchini]
MNKGVEVKVKQMVQVLVGSDNVTGDVVYVLDELHKQGLLTDIELRKFQHIQTTKKGIASC